MIYPAERVTHAMTGMHLAWKSADSDRCSMKTGVHSRNRSALTIVQEGREDSGVVGGLLGTRRDDVGCEQATVQAPKYLACKLDHDENITYLRFSLQSWAKNLPRYLKLVVHHGHELVERPPGSMWMSDMSTPSNVNGWV